MDVNGDGNRTLAKALAFKHTDQRSKRRLSALKDLARKGKDLIRDDEVATMTLSDSSVCEAPLTFSKPSRELKIPDCLHESDAFVMKYPKKWRMIFD